MAAAGHLDWTLLDFSSEPARQDSIKFIRQHVPAHGLGARSLQLEWALGPEPDWSSVTAYALRFGDGKAVLAPFFRRRRPLKFRLGEFNVASARLSRHWFLGEPLYPEGTDPQFARHASSRLLRQFLARLGPGEAMFFEGMPVEGSLHAVVSDAAGFGIEAVILPLGTPYEHQFIDMPPTLNDYLSQLGSRSRQSVQYSQRRLARDMGGPGAVRMECFDSPESADRFVTDASAVSRKTYQWNLLGLGLRDTQETRTRIRFAAENGWLKSYILYCREAPVAFMLGHLYRGCYYYDDVGYDPEFAKWSVGSVLQLEVMQHLYSQPDPPAYFDFSTGFGSHKGRFGNRTRRETNFLVFPPSLRNRFIARGHIATEQFSTKAVQTLDRLGVKNRIKKLIRRKSSSSPAGGPATADTADPQNPAKKDAGG